MDTVDLMLLYYGINTIKVTREVLGEINQNYLEEKLSKIPSDPKGRSLKNGVCQKITFFFHSHASYF